MNATEIDKVFQAFKDNDFKTIVELADLSEEDINDFEKFAIENEEKIFRIIEQKIKEGDYNHFLDKVKEKENIDLFVFLLIGINDVENIKKFIIERKGKNFTTKQVYDLITSIYEMDDILENAELREELNLEKIDVLKFILNVRNIEEIRLIFKDKQLAYKVESQEEMLNLEIARRANDYEFIEKFINKKILEGTLDEDVLIDLILETKDYEFILNKLINPPRVHFDDTDNQIWRGIFEYKVETSAKEIIDAILEGKKVDINKGTNANILSLTQDIDYIIEMVTNPKKRELLKLNSIDILKIISDLALKTYGTDADKLRELFDFEFEKLINNNGDIGTKLKIPEDMTVGLEIESEGKYSDLIETLTDIIGKAYECKTDGTVPSGVEVCTPILTGDNEKNTNQIHRICDILSGLGQYTDEKCGGHIHIGSNYLTSLESWKNLIELWTNAEKIIYIISNKEGELPRKGIFSNAIPISLNVLDNVEEQYMPIKSKDDMISFIKSSQYSDFKKEIASRNYGINCSNVHREGINTIEFRLPNGTVDSNVWIQNVNLFGGIVAVSEKIAKIQKKAGKLTGDEQKILVDFNRLKNGKIAEEEKMLTFMELVIPKEDRQIYVNRYRTNYELLLNNPELEKELDKKIAKRPINLYSIINKILYESNPVTGQDYYYGKGLIEKDIEMANNVQNINR